MRIKTFLLAILILCLSAVACGERPETTQNPASEEQTSAGSPEADQNIEEEEEQTPADSAVISETYPQLANVGTENLQIAYPAEGEDIAIIKTSMGDIKARFFPEYAPLAVENFLTHSKNGYYNDVIFHRVVSDFVIQGGDPNGNPPGTGGESIYGEPFVNEVSANLHHFIGALAMANSGADTNGSQFYVVQGTRKDLPIEEMSSPDMAEYFPKDVITAYEKFGGLPPLDYGYTVFGQVFEGMDIVNEIAAVEIREPSYPGESRPVTDIVITGIEVTTYKK
ncbi:MAG: peptidylprolyl isomerase [Clostridiales bacterium]|jgi:peptidyl-prolyl cis-trans isomerase B (cyclophilin B)|nr:peptidylprolyl isomerase [Clostridiales bacterium]